MEKAVLGIAVPCFNEEEVIEETSKRLSKVLESLIYSKKIDEKSFLLFVDDGSKDNTWNKLLDIKKMNPYVKAIKLSRNVGHQNALFAGLMYAKNKADCIISIDADLQDDINVLDKFVEEYYKGADIVYGVRRKRDVDTFFKKYTALSFYKLMKTMGVDILENHADYRLTSRRVLDVLEKFDEVNLFLRGIFPLMGFKSSIVNYDRNERLAGESKYPFKKMINFAMDGITSFSVTPIKLITFSGFLFFFISLIMSIFTVYVKLVGSSVPGWASTSLPIYLLGGIQLLSLGLIGEYIGKIYKEVKKRPRYIIEEEID